MTFGPDGEPRNGASSFLHPRSLTGNLILRRMLTLCLVAIVAIGLVGTALAALKPYQWTTAQAAAAMMRQAEDFYVVAETTRELDKAVCRGKGKPVQRKFVVFTCTATVSGSIAEGPINLRVIARTRKAGGLCWAVAPAPIPSGCFAPGRRTEGSSDAAWAAAYRVIDDRYVQDGRCLSHGAGFFTCSWTTADGVHRGTVVFARSPVVRVLS